MGVDENYQEDGSENYHELLENIEPSTISKDKTDNYGKYDLASAELRDYQGASIRCTL